MSIGTLGADFKFESKYKLFHLSKCIWRYRLRNGGHFVHGVDELILVTDVLNIKLRAIYWAHSHRFHIKWPVTIFRWKSLWDSHRFHFYYACASHTVVMQFQSNGIELIKYVLQNIYPDFVDFMQCIVHDIRTLFVNPYVRQTKFVWNNEKYLQRLMRISWELYTKYTLNLCQIDIECN